MFSVRDSCFRPPMDSQTFFLIEKNYHPIPFGKLRVGVSKQHGVGACGSARARCTLLHSCLCGFFWGEGGGDVLGVALFFWGGFWGGLVLMEVLITFLAGRLTRYALGLVAMLPALSRTVPCQTFWPSSCKL